MNVNDIVNENESTRIAVNLSMDRDTVDRLKIIAFQRSTPIQRVQYTDLIREFVTNALGPVEIHNLTFCEKREGGRDER